MATHELGHVLVAWGTGGTVTRVVLHPLAISRTDVVPNPHPLWVAWGGPIAGVLVPLLMWGSLARGPQCVCAMARFFAGFCLIANGAYLSVGSLDRVGDAGELLQHGTPMWLLWLWGAVTMPCGLLCWHGIGRHFGFGAAAGAVETRCVILSTVFLFATVALCLLCSPTQ